MSLCKHNRKAWNCRLCRSEESRAYGVALNDADKGETIAVALTAPSNAIDLANKAIRKFGQMAVVEEYAKKMLATGPSLDPERRPRNHPSEHSNRLAACPVPQELYHKEARGMELLSWELSNSGREYLLTFGYDLTRFNQVVLVEAVDRFNRQEYHGETKEGRDSDYLMHMMESITGKRFTLQAATSMIDEFLTQRYGKPYSLDGAPRVVNRLQITFPTTRGLKHISSREFEQWLYQYGRYNQAVGRTLRELTREVIRKGIDDFVFHDPAVDQHTAIQITPDTITIMEDCTINIEHACTIRINGNTFHVRQEGDRMMLLDKSMRRLS